MIHLHDLIEQSPDYARVWQRHSGSYLDSYHLGQGIYSIYVQWHFQDNFTGCELRLVPVERAVTHTIIGMTHRMKGDQPEMKRAMLISFSRAVQNAELGHQNDILQARDRVLGMIKETRSGNSEPLL